jgi:Icc-related predicted phosphoesterase
MGIYFRDGHINMKIAAIADIHVELNQPGKHKELFAEISQKADILCIAGDLTALGTLEEAEALSDELKALTIPAVMVLGNHDYEKNLYEEIAKSLTTEKTFVLEGTSHVIKRIGFAGVKGYIGGFDNHVLPFWGEQSIKNIVTEGTNEALKLERALSLLETEKKVVLMHYSPITSTLEGEDLEIYPFLGSSRFEGAINRFDTTVVFHGHAHHGKLEGKTSKGIAVFNVSLPVLNKNKKEFLVFEM